MLNAFVKWLPSASPSISTTSLIFYSGLVLLTFWMINFFKRRSMVKSMNKIPGPNGNFLLGNGLELITKTPKELLTIFGEDYCKYGNGISRIWIGSNPYVLLYRAKTAEVILGSQANITKSLDYQLLHPWLGTALLTATGEKWQSRRKMLTPAFHFKILGDFIDVFNRKAEKLATKFQQHLNEGSFNIFNLVTNCTLDVILETAMGISMGVQDGSQSDYVQAVLTMSDILQKRFSRFYLQPDFMYKILGYQKIQDHCINILHNLSNRVIKERRAEYRLKKSKKSDPKDDSGIKRRRLAFLDLLVERAEEEGDLTDTDIREEVDTFVFEGHDTTAAAVSFAIFSIGCHPEVQKRVHKELDCIFGDSDRPATMDDLREMKYLECCIKEALRVHPSVPFIGRTLTQAVNIDGYTLPAGTQIMINKFQIHRDPEWYANPEKYDPERFTPDNSAGRHPFAFVPFSAGPRNCIGQKFALLEEKTILSTLFRKFRVESDLSYEELSVLGQIIMRPETTIDVKVFPRK